MESPDPSSDLQPALSSPKKKLRWFLAIILVLLLGLIGVMLFKGRYLDQDYSEELMKAAQEINQQVPMMLDNDTRLESAEALPNDRLRYHFTMVNHSKDELDLAIFEEKLRPILLESIQNNPTLEPFRDHDVQFEYVYKDKNGDPLLQLTFPPGDYEVRENLQDQPVDSI